MKSPSFESPSDNPFRKPDSEEESLDTPKKKDGKKDKDKEKTRKQKGEKKHEDEKEVKKPKKPVEEEEDEGHKKKPSKKHGKEKKKDKEEEDLEEEKKEKRQALIERSLNYKKLYEEVPIPRDPWIVARLMVAEHILAIQSQIEQPAADATPLDELRLLASLDYMGTIADTLENPHVETTPEIKETCDTLVQLAQSTLEEGDENIAETLVEANNESAQGFDQDAKNEPEVAPSTDSGSESLPVSGAALLAVLTHVRQQSHRQVPPANPIAHPVSPPVASGQMPSGITTSPLTPPSRPFMQGASSPTPPAQGDGHAGTPAIHAPRGEAPLITPERHTQPPANPNYSEQRPTRPELRPARSDYASAPLATLAVAAALRSPNTPNSAPRTGEISSPPTSQFSPGAREYTPTSPSISQPNYAHANETHRVNATPKANNTPEHLPPTYIQPIPRSEVSPTTHSTNIESSHEAMRVSQKIEHLPLVSLLAMAETVSIGHGQRLRSAYEKGAIDKDGLVKILKSYSKHHDFVQEYRQQAVKHQNLLKSSPEFLTPTQSKQNVDSPPPGSMAAESAPTIPKDFQPDTNITDFTPTIDLPRPENQVAPTDIFNTPDEKIFHASWLVPVLIAILIIAVGILLAFLLLK